MSLLGWIFILLGVSTLITTEMEVYAVSGGGIAITGAILVVGNGIRNAIRER
jgi:hypothetical protein